MSIRDWVELVVLVILTLTNVGRWIQTRAQKEVAASEGIAASRADLADYEKRHQEEHGRLWKEVERQRVHWYDEAIPWQQKTLERLGRAEGEALVQATEIAHLQSLIEQRRGSRG
jgi:acetoin utilization deacetylase AcuC-like enzyme